MAIGIYIAMTLRRPDTDYDRQLLKVPLRMVKTCSHVSHVCADPRCLLSWAIDHEIHLGRTAPGRALRARLDADTVRRVSAASPPPAALVGGGKNAHQDGTHHEWIHLVWTEVVTYAQDIQIDVPDVFEGDHSDLIDVDDDPFDGSEVLGVPSGYRSRWLERADLNVVHDVSERQIADVRLVEGPRTPKRPRNEHYPHASGHHAVAVTQYEAVAHYDHRARPDDDPEPGDRCKDCGKDVTWIGPTHADWRHLDESDTLNGPAPRPRKRETTVRESETAPREPIRRRN
jgi:hypothetical protein